MFQAYKYTKPRSVKKLLSILHNDEIKIPFEEKCDALIEAIFPPSPEDWQERPPKDLLFDVINNFENRQHRRKSNSSRNQECNSFIVIKKRIRPR